MSNPNPQSTAATNTANTAGTNSANLGGVASGINSAITPTLERQAANPTGINPSDLNAMKVNAAQTAGSATATGNEEANLRAQRTGNTAGVASSQDANAQNRARILADTGLKIQGQNANVKQEQQTNALKELGSLYGTNVGGANAAQANQIGAEKMISTQPGWLQDIGDVSKAIGQGVNDVTDIASIA